MKHMTLEEWDRLVSPYLGAIEARAANIQRDAEAIVKYLKMLPFVPDFETLAEDRLKLALAALIRAGEDLNSTVKQYSEKEKVK